MTAQAKRVGQDRWSYAVATTPNLIGLQDNNKALLLAHATCFV